jgi:hypothetical protein
MTAQPREKVTFVPNEPVTVTLRYPAGKIVPGRFGEQVMWGLSDGRVMFLDLDVAQKVNLLEPQAGESINICKRWNGQKGQPVRWDVWLSPATEKMRAVREVTPLEGQLRQSVTETCERRYNTLQVPAPANGERNGTGAVAIRPLPSLQEPPADQNRAAIVSEPSHRSAAPSGLVDEANLLVDAFAQVLDRALSKYQGRVKPDEVRALLISAYIQKGKAGSHA